MKNDKTKPKNEYEKARDDYGQLPKEWRWKVLDLVSTKTNAQIGPEAEKAFVDAISAVKDEIEERQLYSSGGYGGIIFP